MSEVNQTYFNLMAKPSSFHCNIKCEYCFYLQKEQVLTHNVRLMTESTLENYIKNYINSFSGSRVDFAWQGGEPTLLGIDFFRKAIEFQKKYANGKQINNSFQTNGIALNQQWAEFFKANNFLLGISIDGLAAIHNKYRISINGQPTFERVKHAIELLKKYQVDFNTLTVVNDQNWNKGKETYLALKELGSTFMQFIPIVEVANYAVQRSDYNPSKNYKMTPFSVPPEGYGQFLLDIFNEWVKQDIGHIFVITFDNLLGQWLGYPSSSCVHRETCGQSMVLEANGDVYSCDHFVYPAYKIGNVNHQSLAQIVNSKKQINFGQAKRETLTKKCQKCEVRHLCYGGCPKHRIVPLKGEQFKQNYLCPSYQLFFRQTAPIMAQMRNIIHRGGTASDIKHFM
ncbi:anaerobic sulfatase maturase [Gallibacterium trehalosifermentans]|uniref:Anaerobic sulfatase maturase n=1 Tax=Gallibacterium trehalosifermentans TaxID=516935 RepID=A0ABV6GZU3_9PAST